MVLPAVGGPIGPVLVLACALALAACGGGSSDAGSGQTAAGEQTTASSGFETTSAAEPSPTETQPEAQPQQTDPSAPPPPAALPPDSPQMAEVRQQFAEGMRAYQANDFDRAATLLTQVDAVIPSPELAYNIAYCYQRMADAARAIQYFRRYLETGAPSAAERTAVDVRIAQMEALATRQRDMTMTLPPTMDAMTADAATLFGSGQEMFRRRRYPAALQAFSAAAAAFQAVDVEVPELVYNLAVTSERLEQLDDAADYYDEYLRQRPTDPEAARLRVHISELRGRQRR